MLDGGLCFADFSACGVEQLWTIPHGGCTMAVACHLDGHRDLFCRRRALAAALVERSVEIHRSRTCARIARAS